MLLLRAQTLRTTNSGVVARKWQAMKPVHLPCRVPGWDLHQRFEISPPGSQVDRLGRCESTGPGKWASTEVSTSALGYSTKGESPDGDPRHQHGSLAPRASFTGCFMGKLLVPASEAGE